MLVHPRSATLQARRVPRSRAGIVAPYRAAESDSQGVRPADRLINRRIFQDGDHGSELLFLDHTHVIARVGNHRERIEESACLGLDSSRDDARAPVASL